MSGEFMPSGELTLKNKDGHEVPVYSIHTAIVNPNQKTVLFCLDVDLSERKAIERHLHSLTQSLIDNTRHLESVIQIISHDLRTPMINVSGFSNEISESLQKLNDIIQKIDVPESYVDQVNKILSCEIPEYSRLVTLGIQKMDALLDGLLNIARMGTANRKIESLEMDVLLQDVLQNFEYQCAKKEVLLQAKPLPNCLGDQIQIQCVFANLVSNAIKFLRPDCQGIITITGQEKDNMAIYQVQDNGIGIPKENRDKIFSVFYQINSNSQNGQGLGLAIVKNIVNQHNGQIWVESESNKGSTFSFSIPIA